MQGVVLLLAAKAHTTKIESRSEGNNDHFLHFFFFHCELSNTCTGYVQFCIFFFLKTIASAAADSLSINHPWYMFPIFYHQQSTHSYFLAPFPPLYTNLCLFSAGFNIYKVKPNKEHQPNIHNTNNYFNGTNHHTKLTWKEHIKESSTLMIEAALSNSPQ